MAQGRPVDPRSERSRKPWEKLKISRASFYWRKRYGDLPTKAAAARKARRALRARELTIDDI